MSHSVTKPAGWNTERLGEVVAYVPPDEGTRSLRVLGELLIHKIPSHRTGGAYSLFEATTYPGLGPPPDVHHREDEAYYVLEGEYEFMVDDHTIKAGAGSLIYVPKGTLHTHKNVGDGRGQDVAYPDSRGSVRALLPEGGSAGGRR
jgi:mannose-6-phosphate isomerase-like protein (cupin superfamily)